MTFKNKKNGKKQIDGNTKLHAGKIIRWEQQQNALRRSSRLRKKRENYYTKSYKKYDCS